MGYQSVPYTWEEQKYRAVRKLIWCCYKLKLISYSSGDLASKEAYNRYLSIL